MLLVGTIPLSLLNIPGQILFTLHRQLVVSLLMVMLTLAAVPAELFAADKFGLMGVAYTTAIIYCVLLVAMVGLCVVALGYTSHAVPIIVESLMPAAALMIALSTIVHGVGAVIQPMTAPSELIGSLVVLAALAPCYRRFPEHLHAVRQLSWRS